MTGHPGDNHAEIINTLADAFDRYNWSDRALAGYLLALSDLDVDLLRRAVVDLLRSHTGRKMPSPPELRRHALTLVTGDGAPPEVDDAWAEVLQAFGSHGRLRIPDWSHPLIGQTVESLGGWQRLCETTDLTGARIRFTRAYQTYTARAERLALQSPGLTDAAQLVAATSSARRELEGPR